MVGTDKIGMTTVEPIKEKLHGLEILGSFPHAASKHTDHKMKMGLVAVGLDKGALSILSLFFIQRALREAADIMGNTVLLIGEVQKIERTICPTLFDKSGGD